MAAYGVPTSQMREFGYVLFRNRGQMAVGYTHGDFLQLASISLP